MKRSISLILALIIMFSCGTYVFSAEETDFQREYLIMTNLKYFDAEKMPYDMEVTGTEYVDIMLRATGQDISAIYPGVNNIYALKYADAIKVILDIMGYREIAAQSGGYPIGYINLALKHKLTSRLELEAGSRITYGELARLIYNSFDASMMSPISFSQDGTVIYENNDTRTFSSEILKIGHIFGKITATEVDGTDGAVGDGQVKINDTVYYCNEEAETADLLGYYVEAFLSLDGDDKRVEYVIRDEQYDIFEISSEDFAGCDGNVLKYYKASGSIGEKTFLKSATVIKNGEVLSNYKDEDFDIECGEIILTEAPSGQYDTVIITSYTDFVVNTVDSEEKKIYNEISTAAADSMLDLYEERVDEKIVISDKNGARLGFSDMAAGSVLSVARSSKYIKIIVSNWIIDEFEVKSIYNKNGKTVLRGADGEFEISDAYFAYRPLANPKAGNAYRLYLNCFGKIAYMESVAADSDYAYLIRAVQDGVLSDSVQVKLLTQDKGIVVYPCADKVKIGMSDGRVVTYSSGEAFKILSAYTGVISYKLNSNNLLSEVKLPSENKNHNYDGLYKVYESDTALYKSWMRSFGGKACIDANTAIFVVPESGVASSDDDYMLLTSEDLEDHNEYDCVAYSIGENDIYCPVVLITGFEPELSVNSQYSVVTEIADVLSKDGEIVKEIICRTGNDAFKYQAEYENGATVFDKAYNMHNKDDKTLSVGIGDIIKCGVNNMDGYVNNCMILYDADMPNPDYPSDEGYMSGVIGNAAADTDEHSNPFAMEADTWAKGAGYTASGNRYFLGWVYNKIGNFITITNQNLGVEGFEDSDSFYIENYSANYFSNITTVDYSDMKNIEVKKGDVSDISAYKNVGSDCSRILMVTKSAGNPVQLIIMNY